ncbi:MAG TPA: alkaline phosphatase family protein [Nitrososphaerales archaeon]|nr:alkaline phosphatase family protein [Nitrososphaerales archaeon]
MLQQRPIVAKKIIEMRILLVNIKAAVEACFLLFLIAGSMPASHLRVQGANQQGTGLTTATPLKHVVIIMAENHSFDNVFGIYPNQNTTSYNRTINPLGITVPRNLLSLNQSASLTVVPPSSFSTNNPVEGYDTYHGDWDGGKMDGFAAHSGPQSMTYFTSGQYGIEWNWAEEYGLGDMYFSSYLSMTAPNRLFSLAGQTSVNADYGPPPTIPFNKSIMGQLTNYGVSWKYFIKNASGNNYPLNYFNGIENYTYDIASWDEFYADLQAGSLPSVSWMSPLGGGAQGLDQHPPLNVFQGELWILGTVNAVMQSPEWNSSVIFITYDEGGGYYDQVPPPSLDGVQFGFRVPLIVISPYAKENYVSHTVLNHGSLLALLDYNWKLPPLNQFVADSRIPLDFFDFQAQERGPLLLNQSSQFPVTPQIPFANLAYPREGSSDLTLTQIDQQDGNATYQSTITSVNPHVSANTPYAAYALYVAAALVFITAIVAFRQRKR